MSLEIQEVTTPKQRKAFIDFAWTLYEKDPTWIAPLKLTVQDILNPKHPFYDSAEIRLWVAVEKGQVVGRIAAIVNHAYNQFHNAKTGFFGFFECQENIDAAYALLEKASSFLKLKGMQEMQGPMNPSTNYECGLLVEDYSQPPTIMMTYNPPYYENLLENFGLRKEKDLYAFAIPIANPIPEKIVRVTDRIAKSRKITCRFLKKSRFDLDMEFIQHIYNESWEKNWGFVPMASKEFAKLAHDLKAICDERLILMTEVAGDPAGF